MSRHPVSKIAAAGAVVAAASAAGPRRRSATYVRSTDGATMVEVEPSQFVNQRCLQLVTIEKGAS